MMRALDRDHMLPIGLDLWDYEQVKDRSADILERVSQSNDMPPNTHGGPWPEEWGQVFGRWVNSGFKRLLLGTASAAPTWQENNGVATLRVSFNLPSPAYVAWLDLEEATATTRRYALVMEPPDVTAAEVITPANLRERYRFTAPHAVFFRDASGVIQVH